MGRKGSAVVESKGIQGIQSNCLYATPGVFSQIKQTVYNAPILDIRALITRLLESKKSESSKSGTISTSGPSQSSGKMTNIPLSSKVSSLFDIPERRELHAYGSSITSFAYEPHEDQRKAKKIAYENTYKMEPPEKFRSDKVRPIIQKVLSTNLKGRKYDALECSLLCRSLAEEIKLRVKELNYQRYKILSLVTIGQKKEQGVQVGSRFLWDAARDSFCAVDWSNKELFAVGTVYAVYYE